MQLIYKGDTKSIRLAYKGQYLSTDTNMSLGIRTIFDPAYAETIQKRKEVPS